MIGTYVGSYRIDAELGAGGMGAVYSATHTTIGRRAAIKVLQPDMARDPTIVARFFNEARAVNIIGHSSIVAIYDFGQLPNGAAYIVMELIPGLTLTKRMLSSTDRMGDAIRFARQIASALAAAHAKDIVHRDMKPDNVMITSDPEAVGGERVKILDFGIAKLAEAHSHGNGVTQTGAVMGTPHYMSPEQCRGAGKVDGRSDVYALGVMLYQLTTGRVPFDADGTGAILAMHIYEAPPAPSSHVADFPAALEALVLATLSKDPAARPTMIQVEQKLAAGFSPSASFPPVHAPIGRPTPTTLQSAVSAGLTPPRSHRRWWPALGLAWITVAGLVWAVAFRGSNSESLATPPTSPPSQLAAPPMRDAAQRNRWTVESVPTGAEVTRRATRERLGVTPLEIETDGDGMDELDLRLNGFEADHVTLDRARNGTVRATLLPVTPPPVTTSPTQRPVGPRRPKILKSAPPPAPIPEPSPSAPRTPIGDGVADPFAR